MKQHCEPGTKTRICYCLSWCCFHNWNISAHILPNGSLSLVGRRPWQEYAFVVDPRRAGKMNESDQRRPKHSRVHGANVSHHIHHLRVSLGRYLPSLRNIDPVSTTVCAEESPDLADLRKLQIWLGKSKVSWVSCRFFPSNPVHLKNHALIAAAEPQPVFGRSYVLQGPDLQPAMHSRFLPRSSNLFRPLRSWKFATLGMQWVVQTFCWFWVIMVIQLFRFLEMRVVMDLLYVTHIDSYIQF